VIEADFSLLTEDDIYLFNEGSAIRLYEKLGAHEVVMSGREGVYFAVWAPNAENVAVIGDFNAWQKDATRLRPLTSSGIWEGFVPDLKRGAVYKFFISSRHSPYTVEKADPYALFSEKPPRTASVVWGLDYVWKDDQWLAAREARQSLQSPVSIYDTGLLTSSSCRSWSTRSTALGATNRPVTLLPRAGTARRRTLCISSIFSISTI
jgi:1,4-alpha-glucan branching enzyme